MSATPHATHGRTHPHHRGLIAGMIGVSLVASLSLNTVPLINGVWSEQLRLSSSVIGALLTEQILLAAVVSIALSTQLHRLNPKVAGIAAGVVIVGANIALAFASKAADLAIWCAFVGVATGVLNACAAAAVATSAQADRTYALVSIASTVLVAPLTIAVGHWTEGGGRTALFLAQAVISVGSLLLTFALPKRHASAVSDAAPPLVAALTSPVVFATVCIQVGTMGVWAFTERIGNHVGLSTGEVSNMLAGTTLLAIVGGIIAAMVARPGRETIWAIVGVTAFGLSTSALAASSTQAIYLATMAAQAFTYVFTMPFITAVAIARDRSGGLAAAAQGWASLLGASAPAIAGHLVRSGDFSNLAWLGLGSTVMAVVALRIAMVRAQPPLPVPAPLPPGGDQS